MRPVNCAKKDCGYPPPLKMPSERWSVQDEACQVRCSQSKGSQDAQGVIPAELGAPPADTEEKELPGPALAAALAPGKELEREALSVRRSVHCVAGYNSRACATTARSNSPAAVRFSGAEFEVVVSAGKAVGVSDGRIRAAGAIVYAGNGRRGDGGSLAVADVELHGEKVRGATSARCTVQTHSKSDIEG